jgi:hypothetical protein
METPKKYFQLVNYENQNVLDIVFGESNSSTDEWYYCDWDLDGNGNLRTISRQDAMVQSTLKGIFTERQDSGYGTNIFDLIGEKDIMVKRSSLLMDLTISILAMKSFSDVEAERQNLSEYDRILTVSSLSVNEEDGSPDVTRIKLSLVNMNEDTVPINVV